MFGQLTYLTLEQRKVSRTKKCVLLLRKKMWGLRGGQNLHHLLPTLAVLLILNSIQGKCEDTAYP